MRSLLLLLGLLALVSRSRQDWLCSLCEQGVAAAEQSAVGSEAALEQLLDGYCKQYFGDGWEESLCETAVNAVVPMLLQYIQQDLTPQQVCASVHLCSSRKSGGLGQICSTCVTVATDVINGVDDGTLQSQAEALCAKLGPYQATCDALVVQAIARIKVLIAQLGNDPNTVCHTLLPFCSSKLSRSFDPRDSGPFCQYCEAGVQQLETILKNYVPTIVEDVKQLCQKLPASEAEMCQMIVSTYLEAVIDQIINMLDPQTACEAVHLCVPNSGPALTQEEFVAIVGVDWGPVECNFCKLMFQFIQQNFFSSDFEAAILQDIAKVCQYLPQQSQQQECLNILATYGEMLLNYIKAVISPDHICPMIKMCPSPTTAPARK